jgi:hypothetical protein
MISSGGFLKEPPLEIIFILNFLSFSNDLVWWNSQNKSCRSLKVIKLCSIQLFYLKLFRLSKIVSKFVKFKIQILQTTSDEKSVKMKVVELQKLFKFAVDNFFIWIRLRSQTSNLHSVDCNMWATKLQIRHKAIHRWNGRGGYMRGWCGQGFDS